MIEVQECKFAGYPARTKENILKSDVTLAFALDFYSAGEILTKRLCKEYGKLYIPIDINNLHVSIGREWDVVNELNNESFNNKLFPLKVNIAGNGIYTLGGQQEFWNEWMYRWIHYITNHSVVEFRISLIRSGGQTGIDEAGVLAGDKLGIKSIVLAPKNFMFRDESGIDICNEQKFKERFKCSPESLK